MYGKRMCIILCSDLFLLVYDTRAVCTLQFCANLKRRKKKKIMQICCHDLTILTSTSLTLCVLMDSSFQFIQFTWDSPLYTCRMSGYVRLCLQKQKYHISTVCKSEKTPSDKSLSLLQTVETLMKCSIMLHFIWVFTVYKRSRLGVTQIQRVKVCGCSYSNCTYHKATIKDSS